MKTRQNTSNHSILIWLVSFMMLLQISIGDSGRSSITPLRNLKQTELTLTNSNQKSEKKSSSFFNGIAKHATYFIDDLSYNTRLLQHTQLAFLKRKLCEKHVLASWTKFGAVKVTQPDNEDLPVL